MSASNRSTNQLAIAPLSGEVSDGRLDTLLKQGYGLMEAIQTVMWERYNAQMMRELIKPEYLVDLPGVDRNLPIIEIEGKKRCRCHGMECYSSCLECPKCRHWSYDPHCGSCERHQCGYEGNRD